MQKALIYCRVSSERQKNEGHGLDSQEHRCREFANQRGFEVEKVFRDSFTGGGDFEKRPAMSELLTYLDSKPYNSYCVIFDDIKRLARETEQHIRLRRAFQRRKATVECPNFSFTDSPEGKYVETIMAAGAELEREQNRRQVLQKMKARLEMGYCPFPSLPTGYKHSKLTQNSNSIPVPHEPDAKIIKEALEGYASGRFPNQIDVQRFLQESKLRNKKSIHLEYVKRILVNSLFYAGYVEHKKWEVSERKAQHEGLISYETHKKIRDKLNGKSVTHVKKFLNPDFPLRRFVLCDECRKPLTSSWCAGRNGRRPYFRCNTKSCGKFNKSMHRDKMTEEFCKVLGNIRPDKSVLNLTKQIIEDVWKKKEGEMDKKRQSMNREILAIETERRLLLDRLTRTTAERVIIAYEDRLNEISEIEAVLKHSLMSFDSHKPNIETALEIVFDFLKNPLDQWQKGDIHRKKLVLNLVFQEPLAYNKNSGFETAILSLPLRVFTLPEGQKSSLVEMGRLNSRPDK